MKLRGLRIELGEIESAMLVDQRVAQSVAVVRSDLHSGEQLVGYVVPVEGAAIDVDELKVMVGRSLPAYMVPAVVVVLEAFPVNASGKLDRKALPTPIFVSGRAAFRAPRTPTEEIVAGIFADVLHVPQVGIDDSFFELGGDSLVANQVVSRIGAAFDVRLGVRTLFEAPTVAGIAARAELAVGTGDARPQLISRPRPDFIPLSPAQQRMWFLNQYDTTAATYNLPFVVRLVGNVDIAALAAALSDVIDRHESLRTVYPDSGSGAHQVVIPSGEIDLTADPTQVTESVTAAELPRRLAEFAGAGFDVTSEIPIRVRVFELSEGAEQELAVAMVLHHIAADGMSWAVLARDVMAAYTARAEGVAPTWSPLTAQYADYSLWQRELLGSEDDPESLSAKQIAFWKAELDGLPDQLDLPSDRPRPAVQSFQGGRLGFEISSDTHAGLIALARANGATLFMVMHAALTVLLARLSGTSDISVGTPVAGRGEQALDDIIGMFVNTLVLRAEVDGEESFTDLLVRVRDSDLAAFGHADVPFERLVQVLNPSRSTARHPLFQVVLSFENMAGAELELPGLSVSADEVRVDLSKFDLQLTLSGGVSDGAGPMAAEFVYATDLFDEGTVSGFVDRFLRILDSVVAEPTIAVGDVEILAPDELTDLVDRSGAADSTGRFAQPLTFAEILTGAAALDPEALALSDEGRVLTYRELDERSSRLARVLIASGAGPETAVAVAVPRSLESVLAVWAVVKSGAAFVPVDPKYPVDRVEHMVSDSGAVIGVTLGQFIDQLPGSVRWLALDEGGVEAQCRAESAAPVTDSDRIAPLRLEHPAYAIYTSGSTGRPKGVLVTHANLANACGQQRTLFSTSESSRVLHFVSPSFDVSVYELLLAVGSGAAMVIAPPTIYGGAELADLLRRERVTHAVVTPAALASIDPSGLSDLVTVMVAGEACPPELVARWAPGRNFINGYGPTEATVLASSTGPLVPGEPITIGRPVGGVRTVVLDARLRPVPVGVVGELYLCGPALARGYRGRPDLTADRFVAYPYGVRGERMYRTGDLARWTGRGEIEYLGRSDFQVKVRGFRIELGEIDAALSAQPGIEFAVTLGHEGAGGITSLVSYVLPSEGIEVELEVLKAAIGQTLPAHMVPMAIMVLDEIPRTPVGKLDRKALPAPVFETRAFRAPTTPVEEVVAATFADVLGIERVGLDDDFFELGGNSLIATQVTARLGAALDTMVPVRALFEASTVGDLAARVEQHAGAGGRVALTAGERPDQIPLSLAQQRMWFLNRFDTSSTAYNIPLAIHLAGDLDVDALRAAIGDVVERHESLRTMYPDTEFGPAQVILDPADSPVELGVVKATGDDPERYLREMFSVGFDVSAQVPLRATLFEFSDTEFVLGLVVHHIAADGWSMSPLARDVMVAYAARSAGGSPTWTALPVQYADFSLWQREVLGSEDDPESLISRQFAYWTSTLAGLADQLDLPADRPRPAVSSYRGGAHRFEIDGSLHSALNDLAREQNTTLFMVIHAALSVLLARLSGTSDIAVGTPIAGRGEAALDDVIGMFVNTLVLRTQVDPGARFADLVAQTRENDLGAFGHADVPFERLVEVLSPARSQSRHPLFQVMLSFQNQGMAAFELPGLNIRALDYDEQVAKFDLQLNMTESIDEHGGLTGMSVLMTYATDLFDGSTVAGFGDRFLRILDSVVAEPHGRVGDIDLLASTERELVVSGWNATERALDDGTLVSLFDARVVASPGAVALSFEGELLSYSEFDV
ncbi:amino acid adenylation domain-containing protein, partial [Rhodococcus daqingensis]